MRYAKIFVSVLLATLIFSATDAVSENEVYRWVDEDGVVHFGDNAEGQKGAEKVEISAQGNNGLGTSPAPGTEDPGQQVGPQPSLAQQRREERATKYQEAADRQNATDTVCEQARQEVASLEPTPRVLVQNEDGTVERLDDNKRLSLLAEAKAFVSENCEK